MTQTSFVVENLSSVRADMRQAARAAERLETDITLVAVSKTFSDADIRPALEKGQRVFGENRVQEAYEKWPGLRESFEGIELHLIGPLQSNKVKEAIELFDVIETLDREKLAHVFATARDNGAVLPDLYIQINTGAEPQKAGVLPEAADSFIQTCRDELNLPVTGLMCIPPVDEEPSLHFVLLEKIAKRNDLAILSMGMSADFDVAIEFGATHVRVGSALFGSR